MIALTDFGDPAVVLPLSAVMLVACCGFMRAGQKYHGLSR
jgi:hypothetical protein